MGDTKDVYVTRMRVKSVNEAFAYQINLNEFDMTQHACPLKTSMALQTAGPLINKGELSHYFLKLYLNGCHYIKKLIFFYQYVLYNS